MDDKVINIIITLAVIAGWAVQFFIKKKDEQEDPFHRQEEEEDNFDSVRPPNYADDPYVLVQEEIRRKIAERKAAAQQAQGQLTPAQAAQAAQAEQRQNAPASRSLSDLQPATRREQQPHVRSQQPAQQQKDAARQEALQGNIDVDRNLRPIPQADNPDRSFPTPHKTPDGQKTPFPVSARPAANAYQRSTSTAERASRARHYEGVRSSLRNPAAARQAIVLREVLGPPVALQKDREF